jgi:hypothetical protein
VVAGVERVKTTENRIHWPHKVLTYIEYRAVYGVFQNIDHPPPLHPASVSTAEKERNLLTGEGEGDGGGAKSHDGEIAWFSINQSILSVWHIIFASLGEICK